MVKRNEKTPSKSVIIIISKILMYNYHTKKFKLIINEKNYMKYSILEST